MSFLGLTLFLDTPDAHWDRALVFWPPVTDCPRTAPRGEHGQFVTLVPPAGTPWVKLQRVPGTTASVHLDIAGVDRATAEDLGASFDRTFDDVVVMRSPGGLPFCVESAGDRTPGVHRTAGASVLDQVCLDIPARCWETEVEFWRVLSGRPLEQGARREYAFLGSAADPRSEPRVLLQRLDDDQPAVSAHPDFATSDRDAETARHRALGAEVVAVHGWWTVMAAPSGHRYCLTLRDPATGSVDPSVQE